MQLALPVKVQCRETVDHEWTEMSRLRDVTPFGARFTLKRPTEIGRLLHLTLPMPRPLRVFDHVEDQYRIWCIVRNLKLLDAVKEKGALLEIGVAFIGKRPPRNFESDPAQRYDIAQSAGEMLWSVKDAAADPKLIQLPEPEQRKETRHIMPMEMLVEVFDEKGELSQRENTVTENLSSHGASVFTSLLLSPGRFIKISSEQDRTWLWAVVRDLHTGADGISRLHLEFIGKEWPLDS